ncbi:MAG: LamB/YcsF family protein [Rickettsiales bacterium TMED289]|nr:MAG: LamB/YcsF family protein [Rickettsiales bacterium TMED289]|tara:strand:- start:340 stop:1116 length:777 start_codon:yes stop_codon:yes gene_type:complete
MEININCDLGEKSKHHPDKNDPELLSIVNTASIACGYHAGDENTMREVIGMSIQNGVSFGAHPSFNDPENFGRKRMNLSSSEIKNLIKDQYNLLQKIADEKNEKVTHIKPHGALNNMACEDIELSNTISKTISEIDKDLIYLVPTGSKMEISANNYGLRVASEIFADRNYLDDGNLVSRKEINAVITDPYKAKDHVLFMVKNQALRCLSGKQIPCKIDSICIHGDTLRSLEIAKLVKDNLINNGFKLKPLNKMKKFLL